MCDVADGRRSCCLKKLPPVFFVQCLEGTVVIASKGIIPNLHLSFIYKRLGESEGELISYPVIFLSV